MRVSATLAFILALELGALMNRVTGLVLFFCTFLALKAEDTENRARQTEDHVLAGEDLLYSG